MIGHIQFFPLAFAFFFAMLACGDNSEKKTTLRTALGSERPVSEMDAANTTTPSCSDLATCRMRCAACGETCTPPQAESCRRAGDFLARGVGENFDLKEAARLLERACDHDDAWGCNTLALQVQDGRGVPHDDARALALYDRACTLGSNVGCYNAAGMYLGGQATASDQGKADTYLRRSDVLGRALCEGGDLEACINWGMLYGMGIGVTRNPLRAADIYRRACDRGGVGACVNLSQLELRDGDPKTNVRARLRLEQHCAADAPIACGALGGLLLRGESGIPIDVDTAIPHLRRACDGGVKRSCTQLGMTYGTGTNVARDLDKALAFDTRGCALGSALSCFVMGRSMLLSKPQSRDRIASALTYFEQACFIGYPEACALIGLMFETGRGVTADVTRARALYREACAQGDAGSCVKLIEAGKPVPISIESERRLRKQACAQGVKAACTPTAR